MAAKSYILNYMWTAAKFITKGHRLCTVVLEYDAAQVEDF